MATQVVFPSCLLLFSVTSQASPTVAVPGRVLGRVRMSSRAMRLSPVRVGSVSNSIKRILTGGPVGQIRQGIMRRVAVQVPHLLAGGAWSDECLDHYEVDTARSIPAVPVEIDQQVPLGVAAWLKNLPLAMTPPVIDSVDAAHAPEVRDFVSSFEPHDRQPVLDRLAHIDSNQSVMPRTVPAVAGLCSAQRSEGGR